MCDLITVVVNVGYNRKKVRHVDRDMFRAYILADRTLFSGSPNLIECQLSCGASMDCGQESNFLLWLWATAQLFLLFIVAKAAVWTQNLIVTFPLPVTT